ncbi:bifunctional metallophosphatase/5'-nucleotidase [Haloarcula marismortui]|jgi:2',3'-cyclic-nucleotide 2'-phosphodiesterase/3'-nucleotidase|uniref:2'3'-cyclic-nucleotide 2'-phosphodiesterase n=1 Tax=Haloarcula marismortui ATCC 33800 TaxID=662476 RepID=M0JVT1_9EURY|nr:bifunctional metallophosphatase/5'-nucleotidase [Haloarcula sinaiiensis]EMA13081.1 2'3'-cyclic-nucleotide 2'-phosphodiesterase [Haloarcula sinaiiensis ATCC 33800]QUJ70745.1 5'-nucleotidase C-terminal domain-containing protein [Haloarcula sinaiiensis ATCC 33800]
MGVSPRIIHYSDVEKAYDTPERIGRFAGTVAAADGPDALVVGTGDNTGPGVLSLVTDGEQSLDLFTALTPAFETLGNHDFDHGLAMTREIIARSPQTWLTANVEQDGERFARRLTRPWANRTVDGVQVGFVGVTSPDTASANPQATTLTFTDPFEAVSEAATALRDAGAEAVVVLSHLGRIDEKLARACDVDVILGGHVHERRIDRLDGTLLTRPGANGRTVVEVDLAGPEPTAQFRETADGPLDDRVAAAIEDRLSAAGLHEVIGHAADPIDRSQATTYGGECRLGNLVADAYRWATGADVALQNSGGLRNDTVPLDGALTVADMVSVVPFEEPLTVAELTGAELRTLCRQGSGQQVAFGEPDWWHAHFSGVELVWNDDTQIIERLQVDGRPVRDTETYTLATSNYLYYTELEFPVLTESHRVSVADVQYEALADYVRETDIAPAVDGRLTRR